jgi:predicted PurR-regulated permease PerM
MAWLTTSGGRISLRTWVGLLALGLALWLIITNGSLLLEVTWVLFASLLLSLAIRPLADFLGRRRIPRGITVLVIYLAVGALLALLGDLLVPVISTEVSRLQSSGPQLIQAAISRISAIPLLGPLIPSATTVAQTLSQRLDLLVSTAFSAVAGLGGLLLDVLLIVILTYFLVSDSNLSDGLVERWVPIHHQLRVRAVWLGLRTRLTRWLWAQLAIASYFALVFSVGLRLLNVPFAFTIGLVGGVLEVIPYFGGAIALSLAVLSALTVEPLLALWVAIYYVVVVEVESHLVAPAFYGRVMGLHPAVVLFSLVVGAKAAGLLGVLFAVPVTVVLAAVLREARRVLSAPDLVGPEGTSLDRLVPAENEGSADRD